MYSLYKYDTHVYRYYLTLKNAYLNTSVNNH